MTQFFSCLKLDSYNCGTNAVSLALTEADKDGARRYIDGLQALWDQAPVEAV